MDFNVKFQSLDNDFDAKFGIKREITTFSYGKKLTVEGQNVQLLDQNGNILSEIKTQDTTYSIATEESDGLLSAADKVKLDNVEENVQADWNEENTTSDAYIKNKPTNLSDFNNDKGFITEEKEPLFTASAASNITAQDVTNWNGKSDFSGNYEDLTNKPNIPTTLNDLSGVLPVNKGGTGADNSTSALTNLGAQASTDNALNTTSKTVVGAINELYSTIGTLNDSLENVLEGGSE